MPHYYRNPRQTSLRQTAYALQRMLKPFPFSEANGLPAATRPMLEASQGAKVTPAESSATLREAAALVGSAASILNEDMAAGGARRATGAR